MLTNTWQKRLTTSCGLLRRAALIVALTSCTIVAVSTIWSWLFAKPIDVATPARSVVNRALLVGTFAQDCVVRLLTATQSQQQALSSCWPQQDQVRLPTTPSAVIESPGIAAVTLQDDRADAQQWSVVISVSQRPYQSATPHNACYRLPVVYSRYGLRATLRPALVNCPGPGADVALSYPVTVAASSTVFTTVSGFISSYLTGAGGLERYVTTSSGLVSAADYRSAKVTKLVANRAVPDQQVPPDGATLHVIATVDIITSQFSPLQLDYPFALTATSGRWTVSALDLAPQLAQGGELTPVMPTTAAGTR
jgi:hypothetical protein